MKLVKRKRFFTSISNDIVLKISITQSVILRCIGIAALDNTIIYFTIAEKKLP